MLVTCTFTYTCNPPLLISHPVCPLSTMSDRFDCPLALLQLASACYFELQRQIPESPISSVDLCSVSSIHSASSSPPTSPKVDRQLKPQAKRAAKTSHICSYKGCGRRLNTASELTCHVRTHTGEKPYLCPYPGCGKAFAQSGGLSRHRRTHSDHRPFSCPVEGCGKAFAEGGHLIRHVRTHPGLACSNPFRCDCDGCVEAFATPYQLARHQRVKHTGLRPFACSNPGCDRTFTEFAGLQRHRQVFHIAQYTEIKLRPVPDANPAATMTV